jgi:hypothetical protein
MEWQKDGVLPLGFNEARAAIALAAVSGGLFEIGDDLSTLGKEPDRLALVQNPYLIEMAKLGRASTPLDLMDYTEEDEQPTLFLLPEDSRQAVLTIFNWTDKARSRSIHFADLGWPKAGSFNVFEVLERKDIPLDGRDSFVADLPARSARVFRIRNTSIPAHPPAIRVGKELEAKTGTAATFHAEQEGPEPVIGYNWDFGDGVTAQGATVTHTYTSLGEYHATITASGLDAMTAKETIQVTVKGLPDPDFHPERIKRYQPKE